MQCKVQKSKIYGTKVLSMPLSVYLTLFLFLSPIHLKLVDFSLILAYEMWKYKSLVYSTKTYPCLVLPVSLALYLADLPQVTSKIIYWILIYYYIYIYHYYHYYSFYCNISKILQLI